MSIKEIQERHDADTKYGIEIEPCGSSSDVLYDSLEEANADLKTTHKDRGELLDALKEIGELVECWKDKPIVEHAATREENIIQAAFDHCAGGIKAILDKL